MQSPLHAGFFALLHSEKRRTASILHRETPLSLLSLWPVRRLRYVSTLKHDGELLDVVNIRNAEVPSQRKYRISIGFALDMPLAKFINMLPRRTARRTHREPRLLEAVLVDDFWIRQLIKDSATPIKPGRHRQEGQQKARYVFQT